eukprot:TRINITY_DN101272_c0_g1_i1.p2 TRINITY_DN101272_c0_g1~~TRINITY_DN101272_c0_g1_i1.p2  ORF type:complete len:126 (+),score=11.03 TRINITY_DN101272_c0_g1_i1:57-434(+)
MSRCRDISMPSDVTVAVPHVASLVDPPPGLVIDSGPVAADDDDADEGEPTMPSEAAPWYTTPCGVNAFVWGLCTNSVARDCVTGCCGAHCFDPACVRHGVPERALRASRMRRRGKRSRQMYNILR